MRAHKKALAALCLSSLLVGAAWADDAAGPKDQFQSAIYVRKAGAPEEVYKTLAPDTLAMAYPPDFYTWGGKYMYMWFFPQLIGLNKEAGKFADSDMKDPRGYCDVFTWGEYADWDRLRALGLLTGDKPPRFEDLCVMTEKYALAQRDGTPLPERVDVAYKDRQMGCICISNPDAVRIMVALEKYNAAHLFNFKARPDSYMPVNGGFIDLDGTHGAPMDFSEFTRAKFEAWVRANYNPEQIKAIFGASPGQPISFLTPQGATSEAAQIYDRMRTEFFYNVLWPEYARTLKTAIESVLGPGQFHFCYHGDGYWWRVLHAYPTNMVCWGDWMDSYCTECGVTPYVQRGRAYYALPDFIEYRGVNVDENWHNSNNIYDYQYAAGRLWGEPVVLKAGYKGQPLGVNPATVQLAAMEGMALFGNMRLNVGAETTKDPGALRPSVAEPVVAFMHKVAPQVRQMIPAARVGVLFSPADSWLFKGFGKPSNDTQADQVSNILQCQHVPLQVAHIEILEQTLARRPMDVLIVPWLRCPKDAQAAVLARFVQEGGKVLFVGECGTLTWEGLKRETNAFADLLPDLKPGQTTYRQVGKGRTALIPGALDAKLESAQKLQLALFELMGHTASCVRPDRWPLLLTNLARNSDNSRVYMHLVNYDVDYDRIGSQNPIHSVKGDLQVAIPLPDGLVAKSVTLYRPGNNETPLTPELMREGCRVTVPQMDIYALIAVETAPGTRPEKSLFVPATVAEVAPMVADGFNPPPSGKVLIPALGPVTFAEKPASIRVPDHDFIAYLASAGDQRIDIGYTAEGSKGAPDITVYGPDGKRVRPFATDIMLTLPALANGGYYSLIFKPSARECSVTFAYASAASFEASHRAPLTLDEPGDSAPLYFYVPRACKSFRIYPNTRPYWTANLYPVHLVIKDATGAARLDQTGPIDGGWVWEKGDMKDKVLEVHVPLGQAGRVWSLWLLNAEDGKLKKGFIQFWLDGVPPVVARSPSQLLIAKSDE